MKIDKRFQNLPLDIALHRIFNATRKTLHPAAIILDDNGQVSDQIKEYLKTRYQFTLLQLGVTCTVANLLEHLVLLFTRKRIRYPSVQELRFFTQAVKNRSIGHYFVIERSHYIRLEFLSLFLGLIIDLDRHAQFIFIFTRENFERIQQSSYVKDQRFIFFSKHVKWFAIWKEEKLCKEYESTQSV